jgi:hypothetical protein
MTAARSCYCGATGDLTLFAGGLRCPPHTPAALAGRPEPGEGRYCAPLRCYCGGCPSWTDQPVLDPVRDTIVDMRVKAAGKRRVTSLAEYREAQAAVRK